MPYYYPISGTSTSIAPVLNQLTSQLNQIQINKSIYFYKDILGEIKASAIENQVSENNVGSAYQFNNGDVVYMVNPMSWIGDVPYLYPVTYNYLGSLFLSDILWVDARETYNVNVEKQTIMSKALVSSSLIGANPNTSNINFSHIVYPPPPPGADGFKNTIDLTSGEFLESQYREQKNKFHICLVFTLSETSANANGLTIFKHGYISLRLANQMSASENLKNMICLFYNDQFVKGISLHPDHLTVNNTFQYLVYFNHNFDLIVNNNVSNNNYMGPSFSPDPFLLRRIYIGGSDNGLPSKIRFHELYYFESNDPYAEYGWPSFNYNLFITHFNKPSPKYPSPVPKWNIIDYNDQFNILPIPPTSWTSSYSQGNRTSIITITKSSNLVVYGNLNGMIDNNNMFTHENSWWFNNENVTDKFIRFELAVPQIIDGFQIVGRYDMPDITLSTHLFQGSNNGSTWTTLKQFDWVGNIPQFLPSTPVPISGIMIQNPNPSYYFSALNVSFLNNTAYKYYRTLGVSGIDSSGPYQTEIFFKSTDY